MKDRKIAVAMSGGVDSSVAAALLKKQGFDVIGIFMKFWSAGNDPSGNKCCSVESKTDARKVATKLGIPLYTLNMKSDFKKYVVDDFILQYKLGKTPNPCILCNKYIKFGKFFEKAKSLGCDYVATGHFAKSQNGKLLKAKDKNKDQTYFLYTLKSNQLKSIKFPVAGYTKLEIRQLAKKFGLSTASKKESQNICFIQGDDYRLFLKKYIKSKPGLIKNKKGETLGKHQGLYGYTIGQREGINISDGHGPYYVVKQDMENNTLIVSNNKEDLSLFKDSLYLKNVSWISGKILKNKFEADVKIRYSTRTHKAIVSKKNNQTLIQFKKPVRAVTSGQHAVIYKGQEVLGGGVIV